MLHEDILSKSKWMFESEMEERALEAALFPLCFWSFEVLHFQTAAEVFILLPGRFTSYQVAAARWEMALDCRQLLSLPPRWQVQPSTQPLQPGSSLCLPINEIQWAAEMNPITKSQVATAESAVAKQRENTWVLHGALPIRDDNSHFVLRWHFTCIQGCFVAESFFPAVLSVIC